MFKLAAAFKLLLIVAAFSASVFLISYINEPFDKVSASVLCSPTGVRGSQVCEPSECVPDEDTFEGDLVCLAQPPVQVDCGQDCDQPQKDPDASTGSTQQVLGDSTTVTPLASGK